MNAGAWHGCPICAAQRTAVFDSLVEWQVRLVQSQSARDGFAAARGFCSFHMWLLQQVGNPLSLSAAFAPVVDAWAGELRQLAEQPADRAVAAIAPALPRAGACTVCQVQRAAGTAGLEHLLGLLESSEGREQLARGTGLCLRHLLAALRAGATGDAVRALLAEHARRMRELSENLHAYAAKRAAATSEPISEDEQEAWRRALELLAGSRAVRDADPE